MTDVPTRQAAGTTGAAQRGGRPRLPALAAASRLFARDRLGRARAFGLHALELLLFMGATFAISLWLSPDDPFGIGAQFPWLWLMPGVLALRYGTVLGLLAGAIVLGVWFAQVPLRVGAAPGDFPQQYFLGGLVLVLLCGQFSDVWHDRLRRVREVNHYLSERLAALTRSHFLLQLSHQRIEHELLVRPVTLRDLLGELRAASTRDPGELGGASFLLQLLSQSCELESASMHRVASGRAEAEPVAHIGEAGRLVTDDPLVVAALTHDRLAHVQSDQAAADVSRYLVCAPIEASNRETLGLIAVERLPFFALNQENLQLLTVLLGYYADGLRTRSLIRGIMALRADCPIEFALELVRLHTLKRQADIESALVAFVLPRSSETQNLAGQMRRMPRSLDMVWEVETPRHVVMVNLLALSGPAAVEGFLSRIESLLRAQFETDFSQSHVAVQVAMLSDAEVEWTLDDLLVRCHVPATTTPTVAPAAASAPAQT